jgi:hypothetical protein
MIVVVFTTVGGVVGLAITAVTENKLSPVVGGLLGALGAAYVVYSNLMEKYQEALNQRFPRLLCKGSTVQITTMMEHSGPALGKCGIVLAIIENDPEEPHPEAVARKVVGRVDFYTDGKLAFGMDARWDQTKQPVLMEPYAPTIELNAVDINIGAQRGLPLFARFPDEKLFAFNNDSYMHGLRRPEFELVAEEYLVVVRLRGQRVDAQGEFRLTLKENKHDFALVSWNPRYKPGETAVERQS